jgi:hypothetical protein
MADKNKPQWQESVNFWIDLLTKYDSYEERQAKFEPMTADVCPTAPAVPVLSAIEAAVARKTFM